jgi:hypothetical protein
MPSLVGKTGSIKGQNNNNNYNKNTIFSKFRMASDNNIEVFSLQS